MSHGADECGCFPTGQHYPGIAHLLRTAMRGIVTGFTAETPWAELPIALLDVETTGRDAAADRVIELGIVIGLRGEIVARHNWLIHPGRTIPPDATAIHKISDDDVKDCPRFEAVALEIAAALQGSIPAAYNAPFDRGFVTQEFQRAGIVFEATKEPPAIARDVEWFDPLIWAREIQKSERSRTLGDVAQRLGIKMETAHRASDDAEAALRVLYALGQDMRVPASYGGFIQEQRRLSTQQANERRKWRG